MKKILLIMGVVVVIALVGWFFLRDSNTPIVDAIKSGLPFGSGEDINIPLNQSATADGTGQAAQFDSANSDAKLFRISNTPVAGFVIFARGSNSVVRYVDRATGHIFEEIIPPAATGKTPEKMRITNNTLPKIYEAYFRPDGSAVLLRSLKEDSEVIDNLTLTLTPPKATSTGELYTISATNMRGGIDSVVVGGGNTLFYSLKDTGAVVSSTFTGTETKTLFSSSFTNWQLDKLGATPLLYTKASAIAPGYAYSLNSGGLSKIAGPLNGLTAIGSSDGKKVLYSYFEDNVTRLFSKTLANNTSSEILPATLAEKCVWSSKEISTFFCGIPIEGIAGQEPDGWYQGKTHFSDYIWKFDTNSEIAQLVAEPKTTFGIDLDISLPKLSAADNLMIFINKRDLTLWAIRLN